jgi:hypothetical protein
MRNSVTAERSPMFESKDREMTEWSMAHGLDNERLRH